MNRLTTGRAPATPNPLPARAAAPDPSTPTPAEERAGVLSPIGLSKCHDDHALAMAAHRFIEGRPLDHRDRDLLSAHCGDRVEVLAAMQRLRPDFTPVMTPMKPDGAAFDARVQSTLHRLQAALDHGLAFEILIDDTPLPDEVMEALARTLAAPNARLTAFHFHAPWADSAHDRDANAARLHGLCAGLDAYASLQAVSGGPGVLWLLNRPVGHLSLAFERAPDGDTLERLERVLVNGVAALTCTADEAAAFPEVARVVQTANRHASPESAVRSVRLVYPFRAPRNDASGVDAADRLLNTPHLQRLTLPGTEWLNLVSDDQLVACIRRFGLQALNFDSVFTLSPEVQQALAANSSTAATTVHRPTDLGVTPL
ncbi:hypothetical protein [Hydrogenophaga sp. T2]|uniref:hypothetical protein n=1 Tax=Hydrogenophaga sp. T2 TaxID=3132823 RepID=UPI003CF04F78